MEGRYVLCAAFLHSAGSHSKDTGHYTVATRYNEKFLIFDDMKDKPGEVSANREVIVHAIMYIKTEIIIDEDWMKFKKHYEEIKNANAYGKHIQWE